MKDFGHLVLGCIAGGCLGASTFFLLDALLVEQPAQAIETRSERVLETLNEDLGSESRKEKLRTKIDTKRPFTTWLLRWTGEILT